MRVPATLLALLLQVSPPQGGPLDGVRAALQGLGASLDTHTRTLGAAPELTGAKHQLRDWIETRLADRDERIDTRVFADALHQTVAGAGLLCDDCSLNVLGYLDDIRVTRANGFLVIVTAMGLSCGYDESAYVYAWQGGRWRRISEHERDTYTEREYLPQTIHDVLISDRDANGRRLFLLLGSQTICGGAFKDVYARAWRVDERDESRPVLDVAVHAKDDYPPIQGRVAPDDVLVAFTTGGILSGDQHQAIRHFTVEKDRAVQVDPLAMLPRDFVLEWLAAPWSESRQRAAASLRSAHDRARRTDGVGDFPKPTLRCTGGPDLWQVATHLYERPQRYYRVRWQAPATFTVLGVRATPYKDCTEADERAETYPSLDRRP